MMNTPTALPKGMEYPPITIDGGDATIDGSQRPSTTPLSRETVQQITRIAEQEAAKKAKER